MKAKIKKRSKILRVLLYLFILFVAFIFFNNSSFLVRPRTGQPILVAHRGVHQTFRMEGITGDTNTARRIYEPEHTYLENTIPSMEAAFLAGADLVEFDVLLTKDKQFAVFHDWTLEHRTNGQGPSREYTMEELKKLDIGYGYTADDGKTYPLRGKGVGMMPSLDEVLAHFPDRRFLIHIKSNDPVEGWFFAQYLMKLPEEQLANLTVYGGVVPVMTLQQLVPTLRVMSKNTMKKALLSYMALGWTGYIPPAMKNAHFHLPLNYAKFLWGWPNRFIKRMEEANSQFILVLGDGEWSEGFDQPEDLTLLPKGYTGGIWTNRIEKIGPLMEVKD